MKITIISKADFAGSGQEMAKALRCFGHPVSLSAFRKNRFNYEIDHMVDGDNLESVEALNERIDKSDVIHFKGDYLPNYYLPKEIQYKHKPIVLTLGGSGFRRKREEYNERQNRMLCMQFYPFSEYLGLTKHISVITPDLLYDELPAEWLPHIANEPKNVWKKPLGKIIIGHSPSTQRKKGTNKFLSCLNDLIKDGYPYELLLIQKVTHEKCLQLKSKCNVFIDQGLVPAYGRNTVEAMSMGIPVITRLPEFIKAKDKRFETCPVMGFDNLNISDIYKALKKLVELDLEDISKRTYEWCIETHGADKVVNQLLELYGKAING